MEQNWKEWRIKQDIIYNKGRSEKEERWRNKSKFFALAWFVVFKDK